MKLWLMKWWLKNKIWIIAIGAGLLALFTFGMSQKRYGKKIGAAKQKAADARKRVKKAVAAGDDSAILAEWRRSRKK